MGRTIIEQMFYCQEGISIIQIKNKYHVLSAIWKMLIREVTSLSQQAHRGMAPSVGQVHFIAV
ncbi:MAG: hypothetical protein CVU71_09030 [Deltaproteobacteria bacterium HGW-Deltaproteobacteria-6]|nr:MAG: hypothetical protein CVU71_09030 [Deltaproteobacteria bacterium HGW-Deltaproteobacteria-6]